MKISKHQRSLVFNLGRAVTTAATITLATACSSSSEPNTSDELLPSTLLHGELAPDRLYSLAVPASYTGDDPVPLILALHYGGHGQEYFGMGVLTSLVEPALRELEAIIVAPDCTGQNWTEAQSEEDVLAVLEHVQSTYNIDGRWTLVTGYSMGGVGTWHLAGQHPDRFAAAVVVSGTPPTGTPAENWDVPLYVIHSTDDEVLAIEPTETAVDTLLGRGFPVEFVVLDGVSHYNTSLYTWYLHEAIPWLQDVWQR